MQRMLLREETRRRKKAQGKGYSGGLTAISVEQRMPDGQERLVTITDPAVVEEGCMRENQARYDQTRAPFATPPMQAPLYDLFSGETLKPNVEALLDGTFEIPPGVDPATQSFLQHCQRPPNVPTLDLSVTVEDHMDFWSKNQENKGSEPHGLHNGHFKAGVKSDLLVQCDCIMRDIPLRTGFSPDLWQHLMNFSIEKKPGEFRLSKMRTIQLMNSELQANNKKVGQAAMRCAEEASAIPPGQCGARKAHEAMELVISKRCTWDLLRLQRRPAGWISNDAKSCFDRIVHWVAMVALMRWGIPWEAVLMMFATLQVATHRVRTGFGDSATSFAPPSDVPFQGCGQGNGAGPTIWVAISAILIIMMQAAGFGFYFMAAISGVTVVAECFCFMDDSDVIHAAESVDSTGESIFRSVQGAMDLWAGGVRASGGALNPPKCFWWLIDFKWCPSSGVWRFRRIKDFCWEGRRHRWQDSRGGASRGALMTQDLQGSMVPITQLEPNVAEKTLGVMMCPDDDGSSEFDFLLEKTKGWADRIRSGGLQRYDVLPVLRTTIMKTIEYPMALTLFDWKQWKAIMSPPLQVCLPKAGICRNFPRSMVFAPLRFQGLGLPNPIVTQVMKHLAVWMKNFAQPGQTTPYLKSVLEYHRLETGTRFNLFQQVFQNTGILATQTWAKSDWEEFDRLQIHLEMDLPELEDLREGDDLLQELFINALAPQEVLMWLNWCRCFLNVTHVSEIVTADGKMITREAWNGIRFSPRKSRFQWPRTISPAPQRWDIWREWLHRVLLCPQSKDRILAKPLGKWTDDLGEWKWVYSQEHRSLFHWCDGVWLKGECMDSTRRSASKKFLFRTSRFHKLRRGCRELPADIKRASVSMELQSCKRRLTVTLTGVGDELMQPREESLPSVIEKWKEMATLMSETYGWVPERIEVQGDESVIAGKLAQGKLRIVSDGSFKNQIGTAVAQIRASKTDIIWIYCQTPGRLEDQSAYRSELIGILCGVMVVTWLREEWWPEVKKKLLVKIACDGLSALRNVFAKRKCDPSQAQFDLISAIRCAIGESGIRWFPLHVKGHADQGRKWCQLNWWEKRNVEVDKKATEYRDQLEAEGRVEARNPKFFTEPCAVFIKGEKIACLDRRLFEDLVIFPHLRQKWIESGRLTANAIALVDWRTVERSMKALPAGIQRWCSKHVVGVCGVGKCLKRWNMSTDDGCPLCGLLEDHRHVPRCSDPRATTAWEQAVTEFRCWLDVQGTADYIVQAWMPLLARVRQPFGPLWQGWSKLPSELQQRVLSAQVEQEMIGPQGFLEGLLSTEWAKLQQAYFESIGSRRSGAKWASLAAQKLILIGFHMWEHRNAVKHSDESTANKRLAQVTDVGIRQQFTLGAVSLPAVARQQLRQPRKRVLGLPLEQKVRWLNWMKKEREFSERQLRARQRMMYEFTHSRRESGNHRPRPRTRRVFKTVRKSQKKMFQQRLVFA